MKTNQKLEAEVTYWQMLRTFIVNPNPVNFVYKNQKLWWHLLTHYEWYVNCNWDPERFISIQALERDNASYKKLWNEAEDNARRAERRLRSIETEHEAVKAKLESEIIHLKDLIVAKNLIIEKLETRSTNDEGA